MKEIIIPASDFKITISSKKRSHGANQLRQFAKKNSFPGEERNNARNERKIEKRGGSVGTHVKPRIDFDRSRSRSHKYLAEAVGRIITYRGVRGAFSLQASNIMLIRSRGTLDPLDTRMI